LTAQEFIDTAEPLTEEEMALKEEYAQQGFGDWSRRDFQQFIRGLETHGWYVITIFHLYGFDPENVQGSAYERLCR